MCPNRLVLGLAILFALLGLGSFKLFLSDSSHRWQTLAPGSQASGSTALGGDVEDSSILRLPIVAKSSEIPVVGIRFNQNSDKLYSLLFDTGSSLTMITPSMAEDLNFQQTSVVAATTSTGQTVEVPFGFLPFVQIGDLRIDQFPVGVGPVPLLGQSFLQQFNYFVTQQEILLTPLPQLESGQINQPFEVLPAGSPQSNLESPAPISVPEALSKQQEQP